LSEAILARPQAIFLSGMLATCSARIFALLRRKYRGSLEHLTC